MMSLLAWRRLYRLENQTDVGELLQVWVVPEYRGTNRCQESDGCCLYLGR